MKRTRTPRSAIRLNPAFVPTLIAMVGGIVVLIFALLTGRQDGWMALVFVIPAIYVMALPVGAIVRGQGNQLRVGFRTHDLHGLQKVVVYNRRLMGYPHAVACLVCADQTMEISGIFMTTPGFTSLVNWLGLRPEVLEGYWSPRRISSERPDLTPRRPR